MSALRPPPALPSPPAFELSNAEVGFDECETRTWRGRYRHVTLATFALAFLTVVPQRAAGATEARTNRKQQALQQARPHFYWPSDCWTCCR